MFTNNYKGKGLDFGEIGDKFGGGASTACDKVNTAGTDENLFRLVPEHYFWSKCPCQGTVPSYTGTSLNTAFSWCPSTDLGTVPGDGDSRGSIRAPEVVL